MNISEAMVKQVILEVLQQMQTNGKPPLARKNRFRRSRSKKSGRRSLERIATRWLWDCRRHLAWP
jgi:hypothetical protein